MDYLTRLSEDAVPALIPYVDKLDGSDNYQLRASLDGHLRDLESQGRWQEWPAFNLSRWQAYDLLLNSLGQATSPLPPATVGQRANRD